MQVGAWKCILTSARHIPGVFRCPVITSVASALGKSMSQRFAVRRTGLTALWAGLVFIFANWTFITLLLVYVGLITERAQHYYAPSEFIFHLAICQIWISLRLWLLCSWNLNNNCPGDLSLCSSNFRSAFCVTLNEGWCFQFISLLKLTHPFLWHLFYK